MKLTAETNFDKILRHYKSHETEALPEKLKEELERWNFADNLIREYESMKTIIEMMREKFDISTAQIYRDISQAKRFFASININEKEYYRPFYAETLEKWAQLSAAKDDYKTAMLCLKEAADIRGLKREDPDNDIYQELEPHTFIMNVKISIGEKEKSIELNLDKLDTLDTTYEEIIDQIESNPSITEEEMSLLLEPKND